MRTTRGPAQRARDRGSIRGDGGRAYVAPRSSAQTIVPLLRRGTLRAIRVAMMKSVKHTIYSLGETGGDFAKHVGSDTYDLAKRLGGNTAGLAKQLGSGTADLAKQFGSGTADLAKQFGSGTADLAKRIGPKRGLIGLAVLAAAIGGAVVLVRYLRARNADAELDADETGDAPNGRQARDRKRARAQHRAEAAASH
jgi:hypothetical protein